MRHTVDQDGFRIPSRYSTAREKQDRIVELSRSGRGIIRVLEGIEQSLLHLSTKEDRLILSAIKEVLRNKALCQPFGPTAIEAIRRGLNQPISPADIMEYMERGSSVRYVHVKQPLMRSLAEGVVRYLLYFAQDESLEKRNPIGICPPCDKMFYRKKSHQQFCSGRCRSSVFNKSKAGTGYFREKAMERRAIKREQKRKVKIWKKKPAH
jgi:hypothetical protein